MARARAVAARRGQDGPGNLVDGAACGQAQMGPETTQDMPWLTRGQSLGRSFHAVLI